MEVGFVDLLHPDDRARVTSIVEANRTQPGGVKTFETRLRHKDGRYVWVEATGANRLHDPAVRAVVVNLAALEEARVRPPQLVIVGGDEHAAIQALQASAPGELPILAIPATQEACEQRVAAGATAHLARPVSLKRLAAMVSALLARD